jgi:hypothetical protein
MGCFLPPMEEGLVGSMVLHLAHPINLSSKCQIMKLV